MKKILFFLFKKLPLDNRIVFESHSDFCDNSRALFDYMIQIGLNKKYKMTWLVENPKAFKNKSIENVNFIGLLPKGIFEKIYYYYVLSKAKYIFCSHRRPAIRFYKGEICVNLWHGTGIKNPSFADLGTGYDYVFYSSHYFKEGFVGSLSCKAEQLLPFGNIRNDLLFKKNIFYIKL